jgi:hypothetical protein
LKRKAKSGREFKGKAPQKQHAEIPLGLGEAIERATTSLHEASAVLRSGYIAALYADWHDVQPLMLADVFTAATRLIGTTLEQLDRALINSARSSEKASGEGSAS